MSSDRLGPRRLKKYLDGDRDIGKIGGKIIQIRSRMGYVEVQGFDIKFRFKQSDNIQKMCDYINKKLGL